MSINNLIYRFLPTRAAKALKIVAIAVIVNGCDVDLYSHQKERDVNEMMAVLLNAQIDADKVHQGDGTYALQVDDSDRAAAIALLESHGLPRQEHMTMRDLFPGDSIVASPLEERARFIFALEQNLQETLSLIDGVLSARVHVVLPENNPFAASLTPSSASVFLKTHANASLDNRRSDIKRIVSNSIEGLSYKDVTLTMIASGLTSAIPADERHAIKTTSIQASQGSSIAFVLLVASAIAALATVSRRLRHKTRQISSDTEANR